MINEPLVQHVFKCKVCDPERPCFLVYVELERASLEHIISRTSGVKCSGTSVWEHQYSIPYNGEV